MVKYGISFGASPDGIDLGDASLRNICVKSNRSNGENPGVVRVTARDEYGPGELFHEEEGLEDTYEWFLSNRENIRGSAE